MAPCAFSGRHNIRHEVIIAAGPTTHMCRAIIDADCWPAGGVPKEIAGFLELPKAEWQALADFDRLVLTLRDSGEPYRMILDPITGRFIARQL